MSCGDAAGATRTFGRRRRYAFNSPANKARLCGEDSFVSVVRGSAFNVFHDASRDVVVGAGVVAGDGYRVHVRVGDASFDFDVSRDGDAWLTEGVQIAERGR